jgi:hypothetical protein
MKAPIWITKFTGLVPERAFGRLQLPALALALFFSSTVTMAAKGIDDPIAVRSPADLDAACQDLRSDLDGVDFDNLRIAISHLGAYAFAGFDVSAPKQQKEAMFVSLTDGRTPRQLIVLGFSLHLERLRAEMAADATRDARTVSSEKTEEETMAHFKHNLDQAEQEASLKVIREYLLRQRGTSSG